MSDLVAKAYFDALCVADKIIERFKQEHDGREPTETHHAIAASLFIQKQRDANKASGGNGGQRRGNGGGGGGYVAKKCDVCGSDCWDNRKKKREQPDEWGNAPDFACKDKSCSSHKKKAAPAPVPAGSPFDSDDDDLGF